MFTVTLKRQIHVLKMWISLTPLLLLLSPCQGVKTSCEIPEVEEGHDTTLSCTFSADVRELQQDFKVHFYRDNTTAVHDTVLDCVWLYNEPECRVNDCCSYDRNVNNTLQVLVRNATTNNVGRYVCFVLPASQDSYQFCHFKLKIKEIKLVEESSNTLGALGVLAIIPVIVIVIIIILIWKCNKSPKNKGHPDALSDCHINLCRKKSEKVRKEVTQLIPGSAESNSPKPSSDIPPKSEDHRTNKIHELERLLLTQNVEHEGDKLTLECEVYLNNRNAINAQRDNEGNVNQLGVPPQDRVTSEGKEVENSIVQESFTPEGKEVENSIVQESFTPEGKEVQNAIVQGSVTERKEVPQTFTGTTTAFSAIQIPSGEKRGPPLVLTEKGTKTHVFMQPIKVDVPNKRGKNKSRLLSKSKKSTEKVINPNIIMNKRYNERQLPCPTLFISSSSEVADDKDNEEQSNTSSSYKTDIKGEIPKEEKQESSEAYKGETELKTDLAEKTETKLEKKERKKSERKEEKERKNKEKAEQKKNEERKKMEAKAEKEKQKAGKLGKIVNNKEAEEEVEDKFQEEQSKSDESKVGVSDGNINETDSFQQCGTKNGQEPITTPSETSQEVPKENILSEQKVDKDCTDISKTAIINQDEHSNADSSTERRNVLQDNNPTHGTNVSSCEIDMGTCTLTNGSEDSSGLTVQSEPRQPNISPVTSDELTVTVNGFEEEVSGEETKPKPKNTIFNLNLIRRGSKGGKNKGKKPKDMATPQAP